MTQKAARMTDHLSQAIARLSEGQDLKAAAMTSCVSVIMEGKAEPARVGAFLMGLRVKGESADELLGCARAMRDASVVIRPTRRPLVDTCGTGGDGASTFNISTISAIVLAAAGAAVAKHGNRSVSSRCGSADVLEALGLRLQSKPEQVSRSVDEVGFGFMFAPFFHPAMRHVAGVRKSLGTRTIFNLVGPLTNPARAEAQVIGVFHPRWCEPLARLAHELGVRSALVVHGYGGVDELTLEGPCTVCRLRDGIVESFLLDAEELGLRRAPASALVGGGPEENAAIARSVLAGEPGPRTDTVALNSAAGLLAANLAEDLREGVLMAQAALNSGAALEKLDELIRWS